MGIAGLALSFSLVSLFNVAGLWLCLHHRLGNLDDQTIFRSTLIICLLSIIAGWSLYGALYLVGPAVNTHTAVGLLLQAGAAGAVGLTVYLVLGKLVGMEELRFSKK